jgi:hypothetical protein
MQDVKATKASSPKRRASSISKQYVHFITFLFLWDIFAHLDPDPDYPNADADPADQNQCESMRIRSVFALYRTKSTWYEIV